MPLTPNEIAFLGPMLAEYSELQFGPVWQVLHKRGIRSDDLAWLLEAYKFVDPPRLEMDVTTDGASVEVLRMGRQIEPIPACPWSGAKVARSRNREIEAEVRKQRENESP